MTDTPAAAGPHCDDPHDHSGHDHPPTGADLVRDLVKGLSIQALLIPALGVVLLLAILPFAPLTPVPLLLGIALGAVQLLSLVATSLFVARTRKQLAVNPGLLAVRSIVEELLRVAAVLMALLLWPADLRTHLGIWVGAGCALVWLARATAQAVTTRRRIARAGAAGSGPAPPCCRRPAPPRRRAPPAAAAPAPANGPRRRPRRGSRTATAPAPPWWCACSTWPAPRCPRAVRPCSGSSRRSSW